MPVVTRKANVAPRSVRHRPLMKHAPPSALISFRSGSKVAAGGTVKSTYAITSEGPAGRGEVVPAEFF